EPTTSTPAVAGRSRAPGGSKIVEHDVVVRAAGAVLGPVESSRSPGSERREIDEGRRRRNDVTRDAAPRQMAADPDIVHENGRTRRRVVVEPRGVEEAGLDQYAATARDHVH